MKQGVHVFFNQVVHIGPVLTCLSSPYCFLLIEGIENKASLPF